MNYTRRTVVLLAGRQVADLYDRAQWERCFVKLREIRSYDVDWNDEGGVPPTLQVVSQALSIAKILRTNREPAPSRCHATDEGNIIMSWEDTGEYFELEIDENLCCTGRWLRPGARRAELRLSMRSLNPPNRFDQEWT